MKTKEEKFIEIQKDLEKTKKRNVWMTLLFVLIVVLIAGTMYTYNYSDIIGYIMLGLFSFVMIAIGFPELIWGINMQKCQVDLQEKIHKEQGYLDTLKEDYEYLSRKTINEIPSNLRRTVTYLLSDPEKIPREIVEMREEELEDLRIQLLVYQTAYEVTFWQYVLSKKWLKLSSV